MMNDNINIRKAVSDNRNNESLLARRALAEKATPGPWYANRSGRGVITQYTPLKDRTFGYGCGDEFVCDLNDGEYHEYCDDKEQVNTAAHIAANSPDVVMADIDEILRLREKVERLEKEADYLAQCAANVGFEGLRVSPAWMRHEAHRIVEEAEKEQTCKN